MGESFGIFLSTPTILITIVALSIPFHYIIQRLLARKRAGHVGNITAPEVGGSWPLLGHLHLLASRPAHLVLAEMADKYGPIFTLRVGIHRAVVVNTWEVAKECLTTHDRALASRPKTVGSEVLGYNHAMLPLSPYGTYWRRVRKISALHLLSNHRIELLRHVRESEVLASMKSVYEQYRRKNVGDDAMTSPVLVDMKRWFGDITVNVVVRMMVGRRFSDEYEGDEKERKALIDFTNLVGRFVVSDGIPFLRWLDVGGHVKAMKRTAEELDRVMQRWLDEHKLRRKVREEAGDEANSEQDFMDVMLSVLEDNQEIQSSYDAGTVNKATCLGMILAASDTTMVAMTWALSLLLNNKEALKKAQQELDAQVGKDRQVEESDLNNFPYLQAIIKETLRLYPPVPLAVPHEAIEDCNVSGYLVRKGTRLILNMYKIHRDSRVWPDACEFKPERFLTTHKDIDARGQDFEFIPFGSGRRMCPGISMALQVMGLTIGSFLHAFEIVTPGDQAVDMEEAIGITNFKASPLEVLVTPRIPEHIYQ